MPNGDTTPWSIPDVDAFLKQQGWAKLDTPEKINAYEANVAQRSPRPRGFQPALRPLEQAPSITRKAVTPLVSPEQFMGAVPGAPDLHGRLAGAEESAIARGDPTKAALLAGTKGLMESGAGLASSFTSPAALGMSALGGTGAVLPEASAALKAVHSAEAVGGAGFGLLGASQAAQPRQKGETQADYWERVLYGSSAAAFGLAGTTAVSKDALHTMMRNKLGLNDDLASKVSADVAQMRKAYQESGVETVRLAGEHAEAMKGIKATQDAQLQAIQENLKGELRTIQRQADAASGALKQRTVDALKANEAKMGELDKQKTAEGVSLVRDTAKALYQEKTRLSAKAEAIGDKITEPVATSDQVTELVKSEFRVMGINEKEIPPAALKALQEAKEPATQRMSAAQNNGAMLGARFLKEGMSVPDVKSAMLNLGFTPKEVSGIMQILAPQQAGEGLSFNQIGRIQEDVYQAGRASKDGTVRHALGEAWGKLSDMREQAAEKAKLGPEWKEFKGEYTKFMRGINSDLMQDWLHAETVEDQAVGNKVRELTSRTKEEALHIILRSAGISTDAFDAVVKAQAEAAKSPAEIKSQAVAAKEQITRATGEAKKTAAEQAKSATKGVKEEAATAKEKAEATRKQGEAAEEFTTKAKIEAGEKAGEKVVPHRGTSELAGKTDAELKEMRIKALVGDMRKSGMIDPNKFAYLMYGVIRTAGGSPFGPLALAYGGSRIGMEEVIRNPKFTNWLLSESGIEPNSALGKKLFGAIKDSYPLLRAAAKTGAPAAAAASKEPWKQISVVQ